MSALRQLAESLGLSSSPAPAPAAPAQPAITEAPAPQAAPDPDRESTRSAWKVTRAGQPIGYMVGQPMTRTEALAVVRWRWPDADILES